MILGMTGTREDLSYEQYVWLSVQIVDCEEFHHGACVGADEAGHQLAMRQQKRVIVHPPTDQRLMIPFDGMVWDWKLAKPYLDRNRDIVDESDQVIALPNGPESLKGGTWYTVRYAMKQGKPVAICYPDGSVEERVPSLTTFLSGNPPA